MLTIKNAVIINELLSFVEDAKGTGLTWEQTEAIHSFRKVYGLPEPE